LDIVVQEIMRVVHPQSSENVYPKRRVPVYEDEYESVRQEKAKNLQEQELMSSRFMIATDSNLEEILREFDFRILMVYL